ncbi:MAG: FG-GAP-like repeat-containing protein, partial [Candidatus Acidiferrales bacterium]
RLSHKPGTWTFDFHGSVRDAYDAIGRQFGVTMAFNGDVPSRSIRFQAPNVDFDTAILVLSRQTRTFTRVVDRHTLFVTDDTPQNEREYAPEVEKSLLLPSSVTPDEMNEAVRIVREMTGITRTQLDLSSRTLTLRSTEQNVALAEALLRQIEQPHGEMVLEIELLEVDRTKALQLGITPPTGSTLLALTPSDIAQLQAAQNNGNLLSVVQSIFGSTGALAGSSGSAPVIPPLIAFGGGRTIFLATVPGASANFGEALSSVRSAQRILLRAQDGKPATFFVGDRYPVSLGLLSSDLGSASTALSAALQAGLTLPRQDFTVGASPVAVALGDFNGDGHLDMVTANHGDGTADGSISILLGVGDGTFGTQTPITIPGSTLPSAPSAVAVGDFDGDGNLDIAITDSANNDFMILYGDGQGNFAAPTASTTYATGPNPVALLAVDLNGANYVSGSPVPDLAVVNQGDGVAAGTVSIFLNQTTGNRTNIFATRVDYPVGVSPKGIAYGDFNADGRPDLAVTNSTDGTVSVLLQQNDGTTATLGTFEASVPYDTGTAPAGVAVADFNRDGHLDLAVANQGASPGTVSILLGNGDGTFAAHTEYATGSSPTGLFAADFTGEGNPDLAVTD